MSGARGADDGRETFAPLDLLVVGAGPTGIAIGAAARSAGLSVRLLDRGPLVASLVDYPNEMTFFTTRERLEIAGVPFTVPDDKPNRRQAIVYYQAVAAKFELPVALYVDVETIVPAAGGFRLRTRGRHGAQELSARAVAVATGYFCNPLRLGVPGEDLPWVQARFRDPLRHWSERVVVVGGGNSGAEAALELFRHGARVTLVHRGEALKATVKYWVKPDLENRIEEGSIAARFGVRVVRFEDGAVEIEGGNGRERLPADAAYVLVGFAPETGLLESAGVPVDPVTGIPEFDSETCETPVSGLYVAGTVQAGRETHRIFIENSRDHGLKIVEHLLQRRGTSIAPWKVDPVQNPGGTAISSKEFKA